MHSHNQTLVGISALALAVCLTAENGARSACPVVDFDGLAIGAPVTNQYPGVTFSVLPQTCNSSPRLYMRIQNPSGGGTSSGTRCLKIDTGCPDFSDDYLRMVFDRLQSQVSFTLGDLTGTYVIRYYSNYSGTVGLIGSFNVVIPGNAIVGVHRLVTVTAANANIRRIEVEETVGGHEAIDDLAFDPDITAPVAEIVEPAQLACVCYGTTINGSAYDADGSLSRWTLDRKAIGADTWTLIRTSTTEVTNDFLSQWYPAASAADGYYTLRLRVENACGLETTVTTDVYLNRAFNSLSLRSPVPGQILGGTVCADGTAWDHCTGTIAVEYRPAGGGTWQPFPSVSAPWVITDPLGSWNTRLVSDGDYAVRLVATDDCGNASTNQVTITVDNLAPAAAITSPLPCASVNGVVQIRGTAADAHFGSWALYYSGGTAHGWVAIASGVAPIANGLLANWDTTTLMPCSYLLRLIVTDQSLLDCNGALRNQSEYTVAVEVVGDPLARDSDADGMPDVWETAHGFNPNNPADAAQDADGDHQTNLEEYLAGTDPRNPLSRLRITAIQREASDVRVTWTTEGSHHYLLQRKPDLLGGLFNSISPLLSVPPGGPSTTNYLHPGGALLPQSFYRVRLSP